MEEVKIKATTEKLIKALKLRKRIPWPGAEFKQWHTEELEGLYAGEFMIKVGRSLHDIRDWINDEEGNKYIKNKVRKLWCNAEQEKYTMLWMGERSFCLTLCRVKEETWLISETEIDVRITGESEKDVWKQAIIWLDENLKDCEKVENDKQE